MNTEHRILINARPPLAGMMKWQKNKTSIFGVLRFKKVTLVLYNLYIRKVVPEPAL